MPARYDLGDAVTLGITIRNPAGVLADASTVVLTITLPDGTTTLPSVTKTTTGTYTATYAPTAAGRYTARWVATGSNASAHAEDFEVLSAAAAAAAITTDDLAVYLNRTISTADTPTADAAVATGTTMVEQFLGFDLSTLSGSDLAACQAVAVRCAAQWFTNPQDRASYAGPEGLSFTASPQMLSRIMSEADRATLLGVQLKYEPGIA